MNITVQEFEEKRRGNGEFVLLDVRTAEELALAKLEPCVHIPLHELSRRLEELADFHNTEIICMCHHGMRSATAAGILRKEGFESVFNLSGGIDAYARQVDTAVGMYG